MSTRTTNAPLAALALASLVGLGVGGSAYIDHASVWLRPEPPLTRCALIARRALGKPQLVSGTEPHETTSGETVYLDEAEDRAVRCAYGVSPELARQLTTAFAEHDPAKRASRLLAVYRDGVPPDPAHDRAAGVAYMLTSAALRRSEPAPEAKQALDAIDRLNACRFVERPRFRWTLSSLHAQLEARLAHVKGGGSCPARPPLPKLAWLAPASAAALLGAAIAAGIRLGRSRRLEKAMPKPRLAEQPPAPGGEPPSSS